MLKQLTVTVARTQKVTFNNFFKIKIKRCCVFVIIVAQNDTTSLLQILPNVLLLTVHHTPSVHHCLSPPRHVPGLLFPFWAVSVSPRIKQCVWQVHSGQQQLGQIFLAELSVVPQAHAMTTMMMMFNDDDDDDVCHAVCVYSVCVQCVSVCVCVCVHARTCVHACVCVCVHVWYILHVCATEL